MRNNTDRKSQRTTVGQKARQADHLAWSEDPPFLRELYSLFPKTLMNGFLLCRRFKHTILYTHDTQTRNNIAVQRVVTCGNRTRNTVAQPLRQPCKWIIDMDYGSLDTSWNSQYLVCSRDAILLAVSLLLLYWTQFQTPCYYRDFFDKPKNLPIGMVLNLNY
uniref:SFRICE_027794 n=1 Tax=Spodoptera frugiperda TaxID=7108 RepID=A0A2H1WUL4_SPOFR